jgi:hypothetical protein
VIWVWLKSLLYSLARLLLPAPADYGKRVDPNTQCPVCGNRRGRIQYERRAENDSDQQGQPMILHHCDECGFAWWEPVLRMAKYPAK